MKKLSIYVETWKSEDNYSAGISQISSGEGLVAELCNFLGVFED